MISVAILGYGVVGSGVAEVIDEGAELAAKRTGIHLRVKYILDVRAFPDSPHASRFVNDFIVIERDPEVAAVAECIGGTGVAYDFTKRALRAGKHVITSNKQLVAEHGAELLALAKENNVRYLFEASVGGGIPVLHPIALCLTANRVTDIAGILNGTSNFILTHMGQYGATFDEALREAQKLGYAEADPSDDVNGSDCVRKICILASMAFGRQILPGRVFAEGISSVTSAHLAEAESRGYRIKLLGRAHRTEFGSCVFCAPHLIPSGHPLSSVSDVFNGIMVRGDMTGTVMFYGRGAGKRPTASAMVSDLLNSVKNFDPLGGLAWTDDGTETLQKPEEAPAYTFQDGMKMRIFEGFREA